jgi:glutaredoxin
MSVTLYELDGCPYCEKVHEALQEHGIDYESVWVGAMHSERDEVKRVSGQRGVPVLVDEARGVTMAESARILEYIDHTLAPAADTAGTEAEAAE